MTPDNARLFVSDLPGRLTYFTSRRVTALDGLANSPRYVQDFLLKGRVSEYLEQQSGFLLLLLTEDDANRLDSLARAAPDAIGRRSRSDSPTVQAERRASSASPCPMSACAAPDRVTRGEYGWLPSPANPDLASRKSHRPPTTHHAHCEPPRSSITDLRLDFRMLSRSPWVIARAASPRRRREMCTIAPAITG